MGRLTAPLNSNVMLSRSLFLPAFIFLSSCSVFYGLSAAEHRLVSDTVIAENEHIYDVWHCRDLKPNDEVPSEVWNSPNCYVISAFEPGRINGGIYTVTFEEGQAVVHLHLERITVG